MDSVLSMPSYLPFILITTYVFDLLLQILLLQTHPQGSFGVKSKTEDLLSRIAALEMHFDSRPSDVVELRRRSEVVQYATATPSPLSARH